jgi:rhamnogalacturonyl hydrolase YesR
MTQWSYNQGTMIGTNVLLARVTGDLTYRDRAVAIADAAVTFYGEGDRFFGQPPEFNAIFFENLLLLFSTHPDPDYLAAARAYADRVWETHRDATTGLFTFTNPAKLQEHASMVHIYAMLAWAPEDYRLAA